MGDHTISFSRQQRIRNCLLLNASFIDNLGLMQGKSGIAICFFHLAREMQKTKEFISRVFSQMTKFYSLSLKILALGFFTRKSPIATNCSLSQEQGKNRTFYLSKKELKLKFHKNSKSKSFGHKTIEELEIKKGEIVFSKFRQAFKLGSLKLIEI